MGASALTAFSAGTAFAQITTNDFTTAGTTVSNTFTLNYEVNDTPQDPIDNEGPGEATEFNVDRLVNVTVTTLGDTEVVADQDDALLPFVIVNNGNDEHAYLLGLEQVTDGSDEFDTSAASTAPDIIYYTQAADTSGDGVLSAVERAAATPEDYSATNVPVLDADERVFVFVRQNIAPAPLTDGDEGGVILLAQTRTITSAAGAPVTHIPTVADTDGNDSDTLIVENVLADQDGPAANDDAEDGSHSARGNYIIENPNVTATKEVFGIASATEGLCNAVPATYVKPTDNTAYFTPNSCVEYVITVNNAGTTDATNIDLTDILPPNLTFRRAAVRGALVLPSAAPAGDLAVPATGTICDGTTTSACTVELTNATLASGSVATPTVGYLVIRAVIN